METSKPMGEDTPLTVSIDKDVLTIKIGIKTLAFSFEHGEYNNPYNEKVEDFLPLRKVVDPVEFSEDVIYALNVEREDGSTILTDLFDKAMKEAVEDGSLGVDCIRQGEVTK